MGFHHLKIRNSEDEITNSRFNSTAVGTQKIGEQIEVAVKICYYCAKGDLNGLVSLCSRGMDLNCSDYDGRTGLHLAASNGHLVLVKYLIAHQCEVNPIDRTRGTPLDDAIRGKHTAIVQFLKANGGKCGNELQN